MLIIQRVIMRRSFLRTEIPYLSRYSTSAQSHLVFGESVRHALEEKLPVVALESTIITHGMPFPQNVECALECERKIRQAGASPATIAILNGKLIIGLNSSEIEQIGELKSNVLKTSRRDLSYVVGMKLNGGTTVSGTLLAAHMAGIRIIATGGIGGVHRCGESTMDISADLQEMGRTPIAVVSSGVKSILDIPRTLEYLETEGVFVASFGRSKSFPAFYTRDSGCDADYNVETELEAAKVIKAAHELGLQSGMLFAVPVPIEDALERELMEEAVKEALKLAAERKIEGKAITPFLLRHVATVTGGKSLQTNMKLVQNNAFIGGRIAFELWKLESKGILNEEATRLQETRSSIVVIGGSILDRCVTILDDDIQMDGRIHDGRITECAGGVGRNIYEALHKLQAMAPPTFISTIGDDESGQIVSNSLPKETQLIKCDESRTAQCMIVFDKTGECKFLVGDMSVHGRLSPSVVQQHRENIASAPLIVIDANLPIESMEAIFQIAKANHVPVFFEPTDYHCSIKPFQTTNWQEVVKYITPNLNELRVIAKFFGGLSKDFENSNLVATAAKLVEFVAQFVPTVLVTLGNQGLIIARRNEATEALIMTIPSSNFIQVRHYPAVECRNLVNVSGAGDCLAAGIITAMLQDRSEENCISIGMHSALCSLQSQSAIPLAFFDSNHVCWKSNAQYITIN